jgi:protein-tyrosine phosphatase
MKNYKKNILFVCMGNICRSPAAEEIMRHLVNQDGLKDKFFIDSAGTVAYHEGEKPDQRMIKHAKKRGYFLTSKARKFNPAEDFEKFDYIVTMDNENYFDIKALDKNKKYTNKIFKMVDFNKSIKVAEVPDPYYSGSDGFENVLDILEDACSGLFEKIKNELK